MSELQLADALSAKQELALASLLEGSTFQQAAHRANVAESTVRAWMGQPAFADALLQMRREFRVETQFLLVKACREATVALVTLVQQADVPPHVKLRAAYHIYNYADRMVREEHRVAEAAARAHARHPDLPHPLMPQTMSQTPPQVTIPVEGPVPSEAEESLVEGPVPSLVEGPRITTLEALLPSLPASKQPCLRRLITKYARNGVLSFRFITPQDAKELDDLIDLAESIILTTKGVADPAAGPEPSRGELSRKACPELSRGKPRPLASYLLILDELQPAARERCCALLNKATEGSDVNLDRLTPDEVAELADLATLATANLPPPKP